jgi:hypothetical protein
MIYQILSEIQRELKAPKGQTNSFGHYKYRSAEDILEAVKPLCAKHSALLRLTDRIRKIGDRYYVEATAILTEYGSGETTWVKASAREEAEKKGMDGSQVTGAASSYARKYALNGLFCIDDTKDADTNEMQGQVIKGEEEASKKAAQDAKDKELRENDALMKEYRDKVTMFTGCEAKDVAAYFMKTHNRNICDVTNGALKVAIASIDKKIKEADPTT